MNESAVLKRLEKEVAASGSAMAYARQIGVSVQYLSDVRRRRRGLTSRILAPLGLVAFIDYRPMQKVQPCAS